MFKINIAQCSVAKYLKSVAYFLIILLMTMPVEDC